MTNLLDDYLPSFDNLKKPTFEEPLVFRSRGLVQTEVIFA